VKHRNIIFYFLLAITVNQARAITTKQQTRIII